MVKKRKFPIWAKIISIIVGIIIFLFILRFLFNPKVDLFAEDICFDKQYLKDFRSNPSDFLANIDSYAVSVFKDEIKGGHDYPKNSYFAIRENGTLKEVHYFEVGSFLDSYCDNCLACYRLVSDSSVEPLFKINYSSIRDYKTDGYFALMDENGSWDYYDTPQPTNLSYSQWDEATKLN